MTFLFTDMLLCYIAPSYTTNIFSMFSITRNWFAEKFRIDFVTNGKINEWKKANQQILLAKTFALHENQMF